MTSDTVPVLDHRAICAKGGRNANAKLTPAERSEKMRKVANIRHQRNRERKQQELSPVSQAS